MSSPRKIITENTLIPISLVFLIGGYIFWMSSLYSEVKANTENLIKLEAKQAEYLQTVADINSRLSRIEGKLDRKH